MMNLMFLFYFLEDKIEYIFVFVIMVIFVLVVVVVWWFIIKVFKKEEEKMKELEVKLKE